MATALELLLTEMDCSTRPMPKLLCASSRQLATARPIPIGTMKNLCLQRELSLASSPLRRFPDWQLL